MSCTIWHESLIGRLYGEIEAGEDAALTAHLASCASCSNTLDDFRRVHTALRENEPVTSRVPRVVVLRDRSRFRPALLAASILGAAVLAGAGAGAGYALGSGRAASPAAIVSATPAAGGVSTEELVRREVDRRLAALQEARTIPAGSTPAGTTGDPSGERPVTSKALGAEFAKFERRLDGARAADLEY